MEYKIHKYQKLLTIENNGHKFEIELITAPDNFSLLESSVPATKNVEAPQSINQIKNSHNSDNVFHQSLHQYYS